MLKKTAATFLASICLLMTSYVYAQGAKLFRSAKPMEIQAETSALGASAADVRKLRGERHNKNVHVVRIDPDVLFSTSVTIDLPGGRNITLVKGAEEKGWGETKIWSGVGDGASAVFSITGKKVGGTIFDGGKTYKIRFLKDDYYAIVEINSDGLPAQHHRDRPSGVSEGRNEIPRGSDFLKTPASNDRRIAVASSTTSSTVTPVIDVMIAYTPKALQNVKTLLTDEIPNAMPSLNQSFSTSGVNARANLVGVLPIPYDWSTDQAALYGFSAMPQVKAARDKFKADIVVLVASYDTNNGCGLAMAVMATPAQAFAVVNDVCLVTSVLISHEIGHLMGGFHNLESVSVPNSQFPEGHGFHRIYGTINNLCTYYKTLSIRTIMASNSLGCGENVYNRWSNPNQTETGYVQMTKTSPREFYTHPYGISGQSNMVAVLNVTAPIVEKFSDTKLVKNQMTQRISQILRLIFD